MAEVTIYTTNYCPYCVKAKQLFSNKGQEYQEVDITNDDAARETLINKAGGRKTVPQIFINDQHIGGCDDLYMLEQNGELDSLLQ